jgi:hypothetical protein
MGVGHLKESLTVDGHGRTYEFHVKTRGTGCSVRITVDPATSEKTSNKAATNATQDAMMRHRGLSLLTMRFPGTS